MASSTSKTLHLIFRAARKCTTTVTKTTSTTTTIPTKKRKSTIKKKAAPPPPPPPLSPSDDESLQHRCITYFGVPQFPTTNLKLCQMVGNYLEINPVHDSLTPPVEYAPEEAENTLVEDASDQPLLRQISNTISKYAPEEAEKTLVEDESDQPLLRQISNTISSLDSPYVDKSDSEEASSVNSEMHSPTILPNIFSLADFENRVHQHRKEVSHDRKYKWIYKNTQNVKYQNLIHSCASKYGANHVVRIFGKLGRDTGLKEYRSLIQICIRGARNCEDEETFLEYIYMANELFNSMKEHGFQIDEQTYGPFLIFLIEMHMEEEFFAFLVTLKDEISSSNSRLGYYEMLFAIEVNDETKIQELSNQISSGSSQRITALQEQYLMALCAGDKKKELLEILDRIDIKLSAVESLPFIFSCLGRLSLEVFAARFLSELKECDQRAQSIPILISDYVKSLRNIAVEDAVSKFTTMHTELELAPSSSSYMKLIEFCCNLHEVDEALKVTNQMFEAGLLPSVETINSILYACEEGGEFHLVHSIYSMLCSFNWKSNIDTYRSLINLSVRMKDFEGSFSMIEDLLKVDVTPTSSMYNSIMAGFYREKNVIGALKVLKRMEAADIKPDSITFSYLIGNSDREEDIIKYYEKMKSSGIQPTKHVYMALINAYAKCGHFVEAKQVPLDSGIEAKDKTEVKSVLVSALASNGHIYDALEVYEDMKLGGCNLEPKAIVSLIEHLMSTDKLSIILQLVNELTDTNYWLDGSCRAIAYCVRNKNLRDAVNLLDGVINKFHDNILVTESIINEVFSHVVDIEPSDVQFGLDLLQAIKDELMLQPSRRCLDFLLSTCVTAKDSQSAALIWDEYSAAGLPCNILGYLRMYQIFLASGDPKSAEDILKNIQLDDPHVCSVVRACRATYITPKKKKKKSKKKI